MRCVQCHVPDTLIGLFVWFPVLLSMKFIASVWYSLIEVVLFQK